MPFNDAHLTRTHALHGSRWRLCLLTNTVRVTHFVAVLTNPSFEEMCMGIQTNPAELFSGHQGLVLSSSHEELLRPRLEILCTVATDPNHRPRRCSKHHFTFASISHALPPSFPPRTRSEKATTHVPRVRGWLFLGERRNSPNRMTQLSTCRREVRRTSWRRASPKHATMSRAFGRCAVVRAARFGVSPMRSAVEVIRHAPLPVERKWEAAATRRMGSGVTEVFSGKGFGELLAMRNSKAKE